MCTLPELTALLPREITPTSGINTIRLDAHQHFWKYNPDEHSWMNDQMTALKQDFFPSDLEPLLRKVGFDGSVAVQARQNLEETRWLLELADGFAWIKAVVGWVDLCSESVRRQLEEFSPNPKLAGVRHVLHDEPDDEFMLKPEFLRGLSQLREFNLAYDLLVFPKHLPIAVKLVKQFPEQRFVLDHLGKPLIRDGVIQPWRDDLLRMAEWPSVFCKLSGMVTEAKWNQWRLEDFHAYLDIVLDAFGPSRLMIGSDWPVCRLSAAYEAALHIVTDYISRYSVTEQAAILGESCARFYGIPFETGLSSTR
jgi:L-fuconolactonase